jgi:hypothetical protein
MLKRLTALICLFSVIMLSGCSFYIRQDYKGNVDIAPNKENIRHDEIVAMVYFGFDDGNDSELVKGIEKRIRVSVGMRRDEALLLDLIDGIAQERLFSAINPNTKVVEVKEEDMVLYVTLSKEFLEPGNEFPKGWEQDPEYVAYKNFNQRLAVYSVVNSLLGLSNKYNSVQILIDMTGDGKGSPTTYANLGFVGEGNENLLTLPMGFFEDVVAGPKACASIFFDSIYRRNYEKTYNMLSFNEGETLLMEDITQRLNRLEFKILSFAVSDIEHNGTGAVATVDYFYTAYNMGSPKNKTQRLRLRQENGVWRVAYDSYAEMFEGIE